MPKALFQRSAWLGLVLLLLGAVSTSATAGPNAVRLYKAPNGGSTAVLRLKGAIDALFEPLGLHRAPDRERRVPGSAGPDLGPLP
jgi:hypothetical protein